ncbi:DinB family protein [Maribacter sp. 2307ULW6-5]|uniref:DinB family protein n=1 Tax=Maribacter sp. 2307ULW6-5 TaxID=3386275 RepID=UPI0039BC3A2E
MDKEAALRETLLENAVFRMDESTRMIRKSLEQVTEEEVWQKPNPSLNSLGNLILHVCGNMTQYIISTLGNTEHRRNRPAEFEAYKTANKDALMDQLLHTVDAAKKVLFDAKTAHLLRVYRVQGFSLTGVGLVLHAVEHYSYHSGQIAFWVKQMKNVDLGFYDGKKL